MIVMDCYVMLFQANSCLERGSSDLKLTGNSLKLSISVLILKVKFYKYTSKRTREKCHPQKV